MFLTIYGGNPFRMSEADRRAFHLQYMAGMQNALALAADRAEYAAGPVIDADFYEVVDPSGALPAPDNQGEKS